MDRRAFIGTVAGGLLWAPPAGHAQRPAKIRRIGWLAYGAPPPPGSTSVAEEAFRRRLGELGWIEGRNVSIETRYANDDSARLERAAAELVESDVDVIVTITTPAALAAGKATARIPIVMAGSSNPAELGLVKTLAHPGNNVTGLTNNPGSGFTQKLVQLLKEAAPTVSRVALLWAGPTALGEDRALAELQAAARALGVTVLSAQAGEPNEVAPALASILQQRADGLYATPNAPNTREGKLIIDFALANRLPSIFGDSRWVRGGGLMSYSIDWIDLRRQAATYVDKILRGARPADLPVEQPTKYELVINQKTAKALGMSIPRSLLVRADEVVE
jgi:putative ABC transport system substrate-binding protein